MARQTYDEFIDKFKPKLTTDDCYTPPSIYEAVKNYAIEKYSISETDIVRPFYPGGDYENFEYSENSVVVDNPPFSILAKILEFYTKHGIKFFIFAPTMTLLSKNKQDVTYLAVDVTVTYENGANVNTSFITNLDKSGTLLVSCPDLYWRIKKENDKNLKELKKQVPMYEYPPEVLTSAMLARLSKYGVEFKVHRDECVYVRSLDSQKKHKKTIFGSGYLLSKRATARKAQAQAQAQARDVYVWKLSDREKEMIQRLE